MQWQRPLSCPSRGMLSICKPGGAPGLDSSSDSTAGTSPDVQKRIWGSD